MQSAEMGESRGTAERTSFAGAMRGLLHPKRIAIVGASPNRGFANSIQRRIVTCGYEGEVFPVNPNYEEVMGLPAYPTLESIPGGADLAIVVVPSRMVFDVLDSCERVGVKAVNIITSGFAEKQEDESGPERQRAIRAFAQRTGIRVVGPNCLGNVSVPNKMVASSGQYQLPHRGPIALALQSGLVAYSLVIPQRARGLGYSYVVTLGNEADIDLADMVQYYVDDDETQVIGCFVEQFRRPEAFLRAAGEAADRGKPIVILKVGRSETARRAALAHTGSLVGSDGVADAVMRQYGITRVFSLEEMTETLAIFHSRKRPKGRGASLAVASGGTAGVMADIASDVGADFPPLQPETIAKIEAVIPPYGTAGNPLDYTGQAGSMPGVLEGCYTALAEDPNIHVIISGQAFPTVMDQTQSVGQVFTKLSQQYPDKVFLALAMVPGEISMRLFDAEPAEPMTAVDGVPILQGAEHGLKAVRALVNYAEFQRDWEGAGTLAAEPSARAEEARALVRAAAGQPLVERAAKEVLALYGLPVTQERLARSAEEAVDAAGAIGYPVVLKIESPDISHKTDAGGVLLDLRDEDSVRRGFTTIMENARRYNPQAELTGVLVQEQVGRGHELILGMTQDPSFGPAVAFGLGGIFVETLKDVTLGIPPLRERDARSMLTRLRAAPVLTGQGARGQGAADIEAVVDVLTRFAQLCVDLRDEVEEIDINPLIVFGAGQGATVVDCLIVPTRAPRD